MISIRILVVAATSIEIAPFVHHLTQKFVQTNEGTFSKGNIEFKIAITGVGIMQTTFYLTEAIYKYSPHFCLQVGVAGAFNRKIDLGKLVIVREELLGDLGAEDKERYLDIFDLGLIKASEKPFSNKKLVNSFQDFPIKLTLPFVSGITVNTVTGTLQTAEQRAAHFDADIESMEGAAFHFVCLKKNIPFLQVRSISNYVEPRNKASWKMELAIENLNEWMIANIPQ